MNQTKIGGFGANISKLSAQQQMMGKTANGNFMKQGAYQSERDGYNARIGTTNSDQ